MATGLTEELRTFWGREGNNYLVVGVGRRARGDESAGLLVAERLRELVGDERVVVAEDRPENYTELIRRANPSRILYVLATRSGGEPGETRLMPFEEHERVLLHESPLETLSHFLSGMLDVKAHLLLIEPKTVLGDESPGMVRTAKRIAAEIADSLPS